MAGSLAGRVAVITGAGTGLGREYALLFAREGALVVANDRSEEALVDLTREIDADGVGRIVAAPGDIAEEATSDLVVALALDSFGGLDVLVNNAGNFLYGSLLDLSVSDWDRAFAVHARGHFLTTRAAGRHWKERFWRGEEVSASVINTTSRSALTAVEGHAAYGAAKGAVATFSTIAAKELAHFGVRVNAIAPAARTSMTLNIPEVAARILLPEHGQFDQWAPANVAPLVAYLATQSCPLSGELLFCLGSKIQPYIGNIGLAPLESKSIWTVEELAKALPEHIAAAQAQYVPLGRGL